MKTRTVQTPGVCLGPFSLADNLEKRKYNQAYRKCSRFWFCLGLITAITATKSRRSAYGQAQGFLLVLLEEKEIEDCGQYWGQLGGGEPAYQQLHQGGTFMAQFQQELEEQ